MKVKPTQLRENTIHPLAVKMILSNLEDEVKRAGTSEEQARLNAECLGTRYAISSNWTSFVAVADESMEQTRQIETYKSLFKEADIHELLVPETEEFSEVFGRHRIEIRVILWTLPPIWKVYNICRICSAQGQYLRKSCQAQAPIHTK